RTVEVRDRIAVVLPLKGGKLGTNFGNGRDRRFLVGRRRTLGGWTLDDLRHRTTIVVKRRPLGQGRKSTSPGRSFLAIKPQREALRASACLHKLVERRGDRL